MTFRRNFFMTPVVASGAALFLLEAAGVSQFRKPLTEFMHKHASKVAMSAVKSFPLISLFWEQYALLELLLQEIKHHSIQYVADQKAPTIQLETPKEIGAFFVQQSGQTWDTHQKNFDKGSLADIQKLLNTIYETSDNPDIMQVRTGQVLTKVLAMGCWSKLEVGHKISIPAVNKNGEKQLVEYTLDRRFDLFQKIPAFGFVDAMGQHPALLLFRGTNPNTKHADAWPAIIANIHPKGPAWKLYESSKKEVTSWLESQENSRVLGFSQGAALAGYFLADFPHLFSQNPSEPSLLYDGPGMPKKYINKWMSTKLKPSVSHFVQQGDIVPKTGHSILGDAYIVSLGDGRMPVIKAHKALSFLAPKLSYTLMDKKSEMKASTRQIFAVMHRISSKVVYPVFRDWIVPRIQKVYHDLVFDR